MGRATRRKLGSLVDHSERTVADMILERGGNASNVRQAGPWAQKSLVETAEAAVQGDMTAEAAIKIVKQAKRLGEEH